MEKIFIKLYEWVLPFQYDHESEIILNSQTELDGVKINIQIRKTLSVSGMDLYLDDQPVKIRDNSAKQKNIADKIEKYITEKLK